VTQGELEGAPQARRKVAAIALAGALVPVLTSTATQAAPRGASCESRNNNQ